MNIINKQSYKGIEKDFLNYASNRNYEGIYDSDDLSNGIRLQWGKYDYSVPLEQQDTDYSMLINACKKFNDKNIGNLYADAEHGDKFNYATILDYDMLAERDGLVQTIPEKYFNKLKIGRRKNKNIIKRLNSIAKKSNDLEVAKVISKKINVSLEKAIEIIKSLQYFKEYYEQNKHKSEEWQRFDVWSNRNFPTKDFKNLEETIQYIKSDDFYSSVYNGANPTSEGSIHLYNWSINIKYNEDTWMYLPDGNINYTGDRGRTLTMYPYIATNIYGRDDFYQKFKKGINDFIFCYYYYVIGKDITKDKDSLVSKFANGGSVKKYSNSLMDDFFD